MDSFRPGISHPANHLFAATIYFFQYLIKISSIYLNDVQVKTTGAAISKCLITIYKTI